MLQQRLKTLHAPTKSQCSQINRSMFGKKKWALSMYCCCCCCYVVSVVYDSVRPHRRQPTRLPRPWDSRGKNTGVGSHFLLQCVKGKVKVKSLSHVWLLAIPWTAAYQAPPSVGFSRHGYWSGVPLVQKSLKALYDLQAMWYTLMGDRRFFFNFFFAYLAVGS